VSDRKRHAILVRLLSREQRDAIMSLVRNGENASAALRRVLLAAADRMDLDRDVAPASERARQGGEAKALRKVKQ